MSPDKKSKRQERREKMQQQKARSRLIMIAFLTLGALLVVVAFIWPQFSTIDDLIVPEARTDLADQDGTSLGDPNAPVVIDIFEDFQCSACKVFTENYEPLIIEYLVDTGKARLVFHNYPFLDGDGASNGGNSDRAANATMCASEQNRFWDMQAIIFANLAGESSGNFSDKAMETMAETIGLDTTAFNDCFAKNKYKDQIQADFDLGFEMGVTGTPSVFVNGVKVGDPGKIPTFQDIAVAVDAIINASE